MGRRIAVFGTGYLGATHAACMAELGHDVLGVDVDAGKLAKLGAGEAPFYEPGLDEVLKGNVDAGRLRFTSSYEEAAEFANVHFIAVATPQKQGEFAADLKYVDAVIETLAPLLTAPAVIFGKSTVPVGTAARLGARARELAPVGDAVEVAWNPEFLREGYAVQDTLHPDRIVVGVDKNRPGRAEEVARDVYGLLLEEEIPFLVTDLETSELVEDVGKRLSGDKDFVHQRDGGVVRGDRCRRVGVGRCDRPRRADRSQVPQRRYRLRRWVLAEGYSCVHGPGG